MDVGLPSSLLSAVVNINQHKASNQSRSFHIRKMNHAYILYISSYLVLAPPTPLPDPGVHGRSRTSYPATHAGLRYHLRQQSIPSLPILSHPISSQESRGIPFRQSLEEKKKEKVSNKKSKRNGEKEVPPSIHSFHL